MHGEKRVYTFWHYMRNRWQRDAGLRLVLLSPALKPRLKAAAMLRYGTPLLTDRTKGVLGLSKSIFG